MHVFRCVAAFIVYKISIDRSICFYFPKRIFRRYRFFCLSLFVAAIGVVVVIIIVVVVYLSIDRLVLLHFLFTLHLGVLCICVYCIGFCLVCWIKSKKKEKLLEHCLTCYRLYMLFAGWLFGIFQYSMNKRFQLLILLFVMCIFLLYLSLTLTQSHHRVWISLKLSVDWILWIFPLLLDYIFRSSQSP